MNNKGIISAIAVFILIISGSLLGQTHKYRKGEMSRHYNPAAVETVTGEILEVGARKKMAWSDTHTGVHITVKTSRETIVVHLGPDWFVNKRMVLKKGDRVVVTGSRAVYAMKDIIIAGSIIKGDARLDLRDEKGIPAWTGRGARSKKR